MSFGKPFKDNYTPGDLFYGLADPRFALMDHLGAPKDRTKGTIINYYNVGDYAKSVAAPGDNSSFTDFLRNSPNEKHKDLMNRFDAMDNPHGNWPLWKRKSKGGLWWAARKAAKTVHFCLDGLDMAQVIGKSFPGVDGDKGRDFPVGPDRKTVTDWTQKETSITGAEVRWIYRNRKDPEVANLIQFWLNFQPVEPPWISNPQPWKSYKPTKEYEPIV